MKQLTRTFAVTACVFGLVQLAACLGSESTPNESNLMDAFARAPDVCAERFTLPMEVQESERATAAKYPTWPPGMGPILVRAGLMEVTTVQKEVRKLQGGTFMMAIDRYSLAEAAKPFFKPNGEVIGVAGKNYPQGKLCFAKRHVTAIKKIESVGKVNLRDAVKVAYTYELTNLADFAKSPEVQRALPAIAKAKAQGDSQTTCHTIMTLEDGQWQVGRTPDTISQCQVDY